MAHHLLIVAARAPTYTGLLWSLATAIVRTRGHQISPAAFSCGRKLLPIMQKAPLRGGVCTAGRLSLGSFVNQTTE